MLEEFLKKHIVQVDADQSCIAEYQFLFSYATVAEWGHLWAGRRPASLARSIVDF